MGFAYFVSLNQGKQTPFPVLSQSNMNTSVVTNFAYPPTNFAKSFQPVLYTDRKKKQIFVRDVVMLEGEGNYTYFHLKCGKKILLSKTMKEYCELFEQNDFVRITKSHLINLNYLKEVEKLGEITVIMQSGQRIEISRRRKNLFNQNFRAFKQRK
jgi:DNA-binding LytR/AlgR family response regulator